MPASKSSYLPNPSRPDAITLWVRTATNTFGGAQIFNPQCWRRYRHFLQENSVNETKSMGEIKRSLLGKQYSNDICPLMGLEISKQKFEEKQVLHIILHCKD